MRENGVAQKIDAVTLTARTPGAPAPAAAAGQPAPVATAGQLDDDDDEEVRAAREPGTRVMALYLDEFHVSSGSGTERVRQAALKFLDEQVRPRDLVIVMKPLDPLTAMRFTRDRVAARSAIESFTGRKDDYTPRTPFEEEYMGRSPDAVRAARAQIVMSGLRALTTRMGELDSGLAALVLVTEGFDDRVPRSRERRLPDLQGLVRTASRAHVLVYAFDPQPEAVTATAPPPPAASGEETDGPSMTTLQALARQTGGDAAPAGQDLVPAFQRVSQDLDAYYVVTYTPSTANDGRFRNVQVTSTRREAQVRVRSGYWAPPPPETRLARASSLPPIMMMRPLKRSPLIESWLGTTVEPDGRRRIIFTWVPATGVTITGKRLARADIVSLKATTPSGTVLFQGDVTPARAVPSLSGQRTDSASFAMTPGRLQLDLTILQADGTKLDVGMQDVDVPEMRKGTPVILQPQLFRAASAREFRELSLDANAAPLPGREFRRTERVLLRVPTYEPAGGSVQVSVRLMNRIGSVLEELTPMAPEAGVTVSQFDLPLARFAPGEYSLEIAARSDAGTSRELIRVRITG